MLAAVWAWIQDWFNHVETMPTLPNGWNLEFSKNMPPQMYWDGNAGYFFDFPQSDGVHYVLKPAPPLFLGQTITMKFSIVGGGKLIATDGGTPAHVRVMIQQANDTLATPDARWWSAPLDLTGPGDYILTVPVQFDKWITIGGGLPTAGAAGFAACLAAIANIGFSFGGWSAGHGVFSQGPSRFVLKSFTVS